VTLLGRSLDLLLWFLAAAAWGLATAAITSRFLSDTAGVLLGLAVGMSGLAFVLNNHFRDSRMESLLRGICPRCRAPVPPEHQHRRWDPSTRSWAAPSTTWDCGSCGLTHSESWPCPQCPAQQ
jgi:hypothetical protein